jgi:lipoate-protein ligase A
MAANVESYADSKPLFPFKKLRVIPFQYRSGVENMALDYSFASTIKPEQNPILRFYGWQPYCLSLGYHQDKSDVDIDFLKGSGYDLVRRPTGGSAIFHANELTYSFIVPLKKSNHRQVYQYFHYLLANTLNVLGYPVTLSNNVRSEPYLNNGGNTFACFNRSAFSEIQYKGKKIVGSAQKLFPNAVLQHGSLMLGSEHEQIVSFLNETESNKEKYLGVLQKKSISLSQIKRKKIKLTHIIEALIEQFIKENQIQIYYQYITDEELTNSYSFSEPFIVK